MNEQRQYATAVMEEWLTHPQELGKKPARLEIAGEFDLHDLHYYIFKFKKSVFDSWRVAVCGAMRETAWGTAAISSARWSPMIRPPQRKNVWKW